MHEAALMTHLICQIQQIAETAKARRVVSVSVWIGALSHMSAAHFTEHFEQTATDTCAQGARLSITVSTDLTHEHAQDLVLQDIEVED
jgi:hydrogenase nickel incorporation protein HypA/HybF